jgi:hypothetical protein
VELKMQIYPCHERDAGERNLSEAEPGSRAARSPLVASALHDPPRGCTCRELHRALARAELSGEISEFEALSFQAILAMAEGSEFAIDYLEMADAVAASPHERALVAETQGTYERLREQPPGHAARTECLWNNLLLALCRVGSLDTITAMRIAS